MLIPGMILRKAMKGELPLQTEAMKAFEALMTPSFEELDTTVAFAAEKALLKNLKTLFLILAGAGVQKYMDKLADEQEILMAAADLAIQIFALESAVLRAEKVQPGASDRKKDLYAAAVKVFAFAASEAAGSAARRGAFYVEEGDTLTMILSGVRRFSKYDATGLLQAKRLLASAAIEEEKYLF
jgi:alkylation response protein AidB-like acyl-CoA dehydrogenase